MLKKTFFFTHITLNEWLLCPRKLEYEGVLGIAPLQPFVLQLWLWWSLLSTEDEWEDIVDARDVTDPLEIPLMIFKILIKLKIKELPEAQEDPEELLIE